MIILEKGIEESIPSCTRYPLMVMYAARKLTGLALKAKVRLHIVDLRCRYLQGGIQGPFKIRVDDARGMFQQATR